MQSLKSLASKLPKIKKQINKGNVEKAKLETLKMSASIKNMIAKLHKSTPSNHKSDDIPLKLQKMQGLN